MSLAPLAALRAAACGALTVLAVGCASAPSRPRAAFRPAAGEDRSAEPLTTAAALQAFDAAWTRIRDTHYDSAMRGIDWAGARRDLRPRAERARTIGELRGVIDSLLGRLGESHFLLIPQEVADGLAPGPSDSGHAERGGAPGDVGLSLKLLGDELVVARVEDGGPAARAGVRTGWLVDSVETFSRRALHRTLDGVLTPAARSEASLRIPASVERLLDGPPSSPVRVVFRAGTFRRTTLDLVRRATPGTPVRFGNLPTFLARLTHERLPAAGDACVGFIRFNIWMAPVMPALDSAMDDVRRCRGIVLDLRGNPGGVGAMIMGVGGYFFDRPTPLGTLRTRDTELRFLSNPRVANDRGEAVQPFAGPLAILVDDGTASTSEIFAAGMQAAGRARVFGTTSAGRALPAQAERLPGGDVLMHVVGDFTAPDGRRIEGRGCVPDEMVPLTRADLLAGRDAPLLAALRWIGARPARQASARSASATSASATP